MASDHGPVLGHEDLCAHPDQTHREFVRLVGALVDAQVQTYAIDAVLDVLGWPQRREALRGMAENERNTWRTRKGARVLLEMIDRHLAGKE